MEKSSSVGPNQKSSGVSPGLSCASSAGRWGALLIILVTFIFRVANFPQRYNCRDTDEPTYLAGSLQLLEGITPAMKAAPAGPQTWLGWMYAGTSALKNTLRPDSEIRALPTMLRPFYAVDRALFDNYHDLSSLRRLELWVFILVSVWSAVAMYRLGLQQGGVAVGLFAGLLVALLPLFIDFACMARPYSLAWSFAILAGVSAAKYSGRARIWATAIFLGLAISSRIDMLGMIPLILWQFWINRDEYDTLPRSCVKMLLGAAAVTLLVAPWLLENLIGNLRTIATVRFASKPGTGLMLAKPLVEFGWEQGLGIAFCLFIAGIFLTTPVRRLQQIVLGLFTLLYLLLIFHDDGYGLRHQGPSVLTFLFALVLAAASLQRRAPLLARIAMGAALALPLFHAIRLVMSNRADSLDDSAITWVEQKVKPGTTVYVNDVWAIRSLVPTAASADALWKEVTDDAAWRAKFNSGVKRFNLASTDFPRALSEENMIQERGDRRAWFILGGQPSYAGPRFDIRSAGFSPVFGVRDVPAAYRQSGGVVLSQSKLEGLGEPQKMWASPSGRRAVYAYYMPDAIISP